MATEQNILDRIKKLLALSHSSNPSEAAIALSRAQKLMQEHSISMNDVNLSEINELEVDAPPALRARNLMFALGNIISRSFGTDHFFNTVNGKITTIVFIGPKDRVDVAVYNFTLLSRQLAVIKKEFAAKERAKIVRRYTTTLNEYINAGISLDFARSLGVSHAAVIEIIKKDLKRKENNDVRKNTEAYVEGYLSTIEQKVQAYALSFNEQKLISQFIEKKHPDLSDFHSRRKQYTNAMISSYNQGNKDAENFNIFHGIKGQASAKLGFGD